MFNFLKNIFGKKEEKINLKSDMDKKEKILSHGGIDLTKTNSAITNTITTQIIDIAPNIYLVHKGARTCVGLDVLPNDITKRLNHINKLVSQGHESILEHSNIISMITITPSTTVDTTDYSELLSAARYCHIRVSGPHLLIGGSIRAYMNIIRETNKTNKYLKYIKEIIYHSIEKEFLTSLIEVGLLDEEKCNYLPKANVEDNSGEDYIASIEDPKPVISKTTNLLYSADVQSIYDKIKQYGFTIKDIFEVATVSFLFHDISRSCGNQMTRHRVGISQESQRYVTHDYQKDRDFIDPIKLNLIDRYVDKDPKYIQDAESIDPFKHYKLLMSDGFVKEDARAWLPMNVTTKIMMTFTYSQLAHFLELRSGKAAQKEIRLLTDDIKMVLHDKLPKPSEKDKKFLEQYIKDNNVYTDQSLDLATLLIYGCIAYAVIDEIHDEIVNENTVDEVVSQATEEIEDNMPEPLDQQSMIDSMVSETDYHNSDWDDNQKSNNYTMDSDWSSSSNTDSGSSGGSDW